MLLWIEDPDRLSKFFSDDADRLEQIRIVGDENRHLILTSVPVAQQVRGDVHVGALFLRLDYLDLFGRILCEGHQHCVGQEVTFVDG